MKENLGGVLLRTKETNDKYREFGEKIKKGEIKSDFDNIEKLKERTVKEFKYWFIIENRFPYDAISNIHHILLPKRKVKFDWNLLNQEELNELKEIREKYLSNHYDALYESLGSKRSYDEWFHLQLLILKRY